MLIKLTGNTLTNSLFDLSWNLGTYPIDMNASFESRDSSEKNVLPYYQWIPFILLFQAMLFMIPNLIWHTLSGKTGVEVSVLGHNAKKLDSFDSDKRNRTIDQLTRHVSIYLSSKYNYEPMYKIFNNKSLLPFGGKRGNYLFFYYMLIKCLYVLNIFAQLYIMDLFFKFGQYSFGFDFMKKFLLGLKIPSVDLVFPRY